MALRIATNGSYVEVATDPALVALKRFTVVGWFNIDDFASLRGVWSIGLTGANDRIFHGTDVTTGQGLVYSFESANSKYRGISTTHSYTAGAWTHLACLVDITGGTQDVAAFTMIPNAGWRDSTYAADSGATGALALPATATFRVGTDHDGDNPKGYSAHVRVFDRHLTVSEIAANMWSRECPPALQRDCLIDLPLEADLVNRGTIGGAAVSTGTTSFAGAPPLGRAKPRGIRSVAAVNQTASPAVIAAAGAVGSSTLSATGIAAPGAPAAAGAVGTTTPAASGVGPASLAAATAAVLAASIVATGLAAPTSAASSGAIGAPTVSATGTAPAGSPAATGALGAPVISATGTPGAGAPAAVGALGAPTLQIDGVATAGSLASSASVPNGSPTATGTAPAGTASATGTVPAPSIEATATAIAGYAAALGSVATVIITSDSAAPSSALPATSSIPTPQIVASGTVAPGVIATVVLMPTALTAASACVMAQALAAHGVVPTPTVLGVVIVERPLRPPLTTWAHDNRLTTVGVINVLLTTATDNRLTTEA